MAAKGEDVDSSPGTSGLAKFKCEIIYLKFATSFKENIAEPATNVKLSIHTQAFTLQEEACYNDALKITPRFILQTFAKQILKANRR